MSDPPASVQTLHAQAEQILATWHAIVWSDMFSMDCNERVRGGWQQRERWLVELITAALTTTYQEGVRDGAVKQRTVDAGADAA